MAKSVDFINGVTNPVIGTTAISDESGQIVIVTKVLRYNGNGRFACAFTDNGTFRSTPATVFTTDVGPTAGFLQTVGPNVLRTYTRNGVSGNIIRESSPATNIAIQSHDLTQGPWAAFQGAITVTQDAVGIDGLPNNATTLLQTVANSRWGQNSSIIPRDNNSHTVVFWVKKDNDQTRFPAFFAGIFGGPDVAVRGAILDTKTGAFSTVGFANIGINSVQVLDENLWWAVEFTLTNNNSQSFLQVTPIIWPCASTIGLGTLNNPTTGNPIIIGNVDILLNTFGPSYNQQVPMPILTTNVPVFRDADTIGTTAGIMDFYFDGIWKAKQYVPIRYRDEEGVEKNM